MQPQTIGKSNEAPSPQPAKSQPDQRRSRASRSGEATGRRCEPWESRTVVTDVVVVLVMVVVVFVMVVVERFVVVVLLCCGGRGGRSVSF